MLEGAKVVADFFSEESSGVAEGVYGYVGRTNGGFTEFQLSGFNQPINHKSTNYRRILNQQVE
jgi:hypothetical protein